MGKIYIVLTDSGTPMSKLIKKSKGYQYAHVSISLDKDLTRMYSFGRLNPYNAIVGGFVQESPEFGTFKRFKDTYSLILEVDVTESQYKRMEEIVDEFEKNKNIYSFNISGLFLSGINVKRKKENHFYCAEFIKYIFDGAECCYDLPDVVVPDHFLELETSTIVYEGKLNSYKQHQFII